MPARMRCRHGGLTVRMLPCHRGTCPVCQGAWRLRVANKIQQGASRLLVQGWEFHFLTLTIRDVDGNETHPEMLDRLMGAWRRLQQGRWWREHGPAGPRFRVVENGSHTGRPHLHLVVAGDLPYVRKARDKESLASWRADLSAEGRELVAALEAAGLGPITHSEHLHGGAQGVAKYLGGYLSKSEKRLVRPDGRTVRVAEGSRDWPAVEHSKTTYAVASVAIEPAGDACECVRCGQERAAAAEDGDWAALRRLNVAHWWRDVNPQDKDVQADVRAAVDAADTYKAARAAVEPGRRHLIVGRRTGAPAVDMPAGRAGAVPAGAGAGPAAPDAAAQDGPGADVQDAQDAAPPHTQRHGGVCVGVCAEPEPAEGGRPSDAPGRDVVPVPQDVAAASWCRQVAIDALERVRRRGYDGSMRLLRDMAAAGFDVEAVVA